MQRPTESGPSQPLTASIWFEDKALNRYHLAASEIITFHNYRPADHLEREIAELELYGRPIICTEWLARTCGSLVDTHLPVFASRKVGCINWGLVAGKTNTIYAWQDLNNPMNRIDLSTSDDCGVPKVWFHDLFRLDGTPYNLAEIEVFKQYAGRRIQASPNTPQPDVA